MSHTVVAIDLGASSGRVLAGTLDQGVLAVEECSRFPNGPVRVPVEGEDDLQWDVLFLWEGIRNGLTEAARRGPVDAIGIDTWGVDYGLLDADGRLLGDPASYRSPRTGPAVRAVHALMPQAELYTHNGVQHQPFNTLFQLVADRGRTPVREGAARTALLLPDLLAYWLTGRRVCEVTNASTTGMIDPATRSWSPEVLGLLHDRFGVEVPALLAPLIEPGTLIGPASLEDIPLRTRGGEPTPVVAVGSHDTASAVVGVPAPGRASVGFVSSGTWSLVGIELDHPVRTEESMAANFTNELGVDGTVRYLKNIMGMWIQQECLRQWRDADMRGMSWKVLDAETEASQPLRTLVDVSDPSFAAPGAMTGRIDAWAAAHGEPQPRERAQYLRAITESLAVAYRRALREATTLSGTPIDTVHIVGGGSKNALLCQSTADATGLPVVSGPVEGTAIGNMVVQLRAVGALAGGLDELREVVASSVTTTRFEPAPGRTRLWDEAERRVFAAEEASSPIR
jgi:rhamnulokinase